MKLSESIREKYAKQNLFVKACMIYTLVVVCAALVLTGIDKLRQFIK